MFVFISKYNDPVTKLTEAVGTEFVNEAIPNKDPVIP